MPNSWPSTPLEDAAVGTVPSFVLPLRLALSTSEEDRPIRTLAAALALTLLLPAAATAHDSLDGSHWPTADELRLDLQDIGYEFGYDPSARAHDAEFHADWPALWRISEPAVSSDDPAASADYDLFSVEFIDNGDQPTFVLFSTNGLGEEQGAMDRLAPALMEIAPRLPAGTGIDVAVWYMTNLWLHEPGAEQRTTLPCVVSEFEGGATFVAPFGGDAATPGFFGAIGRYEDLPGHLEQVEGCKTLQAQAPATAAGVEPAEGSDAPTKTADYTVTPDEAVAMIKADEWTVIDVRTPAEYEQAHIVGAINIDVEAPDFADRMAELDPDEPYLLYCRTGRRSAIAADQMNAAGFTDITDAAGLADLARASAPIE